MLHHKKKPMTRMRFVCTFLPKLFIILTLVAYVVGGSILYSVNEKSWQRAIDVWGLITIILCILCIIWLSIGSGIMQNERKNK